MEPVSRLIPHRPPFRLVDRVLSVEGGTVVAEKRVAADDPSMHGALAAAEVSTSFGSQLAQVTLALIAVCALAALVLRLLRGRVASASGPIRVVGRLALEPRRTLYVVEVAGRCLLVGA